MFRDAFEPPPARDGDPLDAVQWVAAFLAVALVIYVIGAP